MKLQFKNQQYQEDAAKSVVDIFISQKNGQYKKLIDRVTKDKGTLIEQDVDIYSFSNNLINIDHSSLRQNIKNVQNRNQLDLTQDEKFDNDELYYKNFSIEMETGTGKTYTYINTMYKLNIAYEFSKFIVMVPSIAIREGTLKTFQITEEHFKEKYGKKIRYFVYDSNNSSNIADIKSFSEDNNINVIIMNYQAFNVKSKEQRKIYDELDELQSRKPIDIIKNTNPILILDEPQKMGNAEEKLKEFNPLFVLRYSATHKLDRVYNLIYRLDSVDAYNKRLVKKIGVIGCEVHNDKSIGAYIYLSEVEISKSEPRARIEMEVKSKNGTRKTMKWIKRGDRLYDLSGELNSYKDYTVSEIDCTGNTNKVVFSNGEEIKMNELVGSTEDILLYRNQIKETIKTHFDKEEMLFDRGIKVLSLFFIDEVAKYRVYNENGAINGEYANVFEELYNEIYEERLKQNKDNAYGEYLLSLKNKKIHDGYFSIDKKKSKKGEEIVYIDSKADKKTGESDDRDAFDLIMKNKERLLSFEEPVRFIFSHSALREGWDNPNIFQICTLKKNNSEISKRQEIGRGMRICVNQDGLRQDAEVLDTEFHNINKLTVIASESYESFAKSLQEEIINSLSRKSYEKMELSHFINKKLISNDNQNDFIVIDENLYQDIRDEFCFTYKYIEKKNGQNNMITTKLKEDIASDKLIIPHKLEKYSNSFKNLIKELYTDIKLKIDNDSKVSIPKELKPNKNFNKKEFIELWEKINVRTSYEVDFDSKELIDNAVKELDDNLVISKTVVEITMGIQNEYISFDDIKKNLSMAEKEKTRRVEDMTGYSSTKYDLVGELSSSCKLTRKTIAIILSKIKAETFNKFKDNPEEFIRKATNLIVEQKGTTIIDGLRYNKLDKKFDDQDIWTINSMGAKLDNNAISSRKCIFDYVLYDSINEKNFANEFEKSAEVSVYAKLPNKFYIDTPLGKYNPDWALCFNDKQYKYIYFIAETKGNLGSAHLRPIEDKKIECAKKHFSLIFDDEKDIKFDKVSSYDELLSKLNGG